MLGRLCIKMAVGVLHPEIEYVDNCFGTCPDEKPVVDGLDAVYRVAIHHIYVLSLIHSRRSEIMQSEYRQ
jgi:hypothetical protein